LRRVASVAVLCLLTIRAASSAPQINAINGPPPGPRTAMIAGQVVDASGAPVAEAVVLLRMTKYAQQLPTTPKARVVTDRQGRYFFADLPAGAFYLHAMKEGYSGGTYGTRLASGESLSLSLAEGEHRTDTKLTLWKYAVISGTVMDEAGEPVVGVTVSALVKDIVAGRVRFGSAPITPYLVPTTTTDDRGAFRLSVTPGTYIVVVPSTEITVPVSVLNAASQDRDLMTGLFLAGISEVTPIGSPHTQQFADAAVMTPNRAMAPPPVSPTGRMEAYPTTYFPSTATTGAATQIALKDGQEQTDIAIRMRPVPAVRVSGHIVTADGTVPPPMGIRLVGNASTDVGEVGFETAIGVSDARGRFTLLGVPAGEYVLKNADRAIMAAVQRGEPSWSVAQHINVGTADIPDLTVTVRPPLRVEGRIEIAGAAGTTTVPPTLATNFIYLEPQLGDAIHLLARLGSTFSFATAGAPGGYVVQSDEFGGWFIKSVTLDGKDITDRAFDLQTDVTSIVITFTDKPTRVSGTVRDAHGAPATEVSVLAFPVDPARWLGQGPNPRELKSAPASRTGTYAFENLPAGDYFVVAIDGAAAEGWQSPARLEALAREATRVTVVAGEPKTVDLMLKVIR